MGVVHHHRNERDLARTLCQRSYETALDLGDSVLAAEALNALAGFDFEAGSIKEAREKFYQALELGGASRSCGAGPNRTWASWPTSRVPWPKLWPITSAHSEPSRARDDRGCAIAYHNLGMVSADRE